MTRKVRFKSHEAALARGGELLEQSSHRKSVNQPNHFRAYFCNYCGGWHLTSK